MTAREQLEAAVWQAMRAWRISSPHPVPFVDAILKAADTYALTEGGITHDRRQVLARATAKTIHFGERAHVCAVLTDGPPSLSTDPAKVTCAKCQRTRAWRTAAATAWNAIAGATQ